MLVTRVSNLVTAIESKISRKVAEDTKKLFDEIRQQIGVSTIKKPKFKQSDTWETVLSQLENLVLNCTITHKCLHWVDQLEDKLDGIIGVAAVPEDKAGYWAHLRQLAQQLDFTDLASADERFIRGCKSMEKAARQAGLNPDNYNTWNDLVDDIINPPEDDDDD